jgi:hypothetical protein
MTTPTGNEVQVVTCTATSGTWTLSYGAETTAALAFDITGADLKTALVALNAFSTNDLTVSGDGPYTITFTGALQDSNVPQLVPASIDLSVGYVLTVTTTSPGDPPAAETLYCDISVANGLVANVEVLLGQTPPTGKIRVSKADYLA